MEEIPIGGGAKPRTPVGVPETAPVKLVPCPTCNRTFAEKALSRHSKVCASLQARPKTATFDSSRQRAKGSDITPAAVERARKGLAGCSIERPKTAWKERHEDLIRNVKSAKTVNHALKTGAPLPPPPKQRPYTSPPK